MAQQMIFANGRTVHVLIDIQGKWYVYDGKVIGRSKGRVYVKEDLTGKVYDFSPSDRKMCLSRIEAETLASIYNA